MAAPASAPSPGPGTRVRVWGLGTRLLHWALALGILVCLATHENVGRVHEWAGYAVLALASWRVLLGLAGPRSMRFAHFVHGPRATLAYAREVLAHRERRHLNHNPLGAWMIVALLGGAVLAAGSGALYVTDAYWGVEWVEELHEALSEVFFLLVPLHLAGVVFSSWRHRENLARAMVNGRKRAAAGDDIAA